MLKLSKRIGRVIILKAKVIQLEEAFDEVTHKMISADLCSHEAVPLAVGGCGVAPLGGGEDLEEHPTVAPAVVPAGLPQVPVPDPSRVGVGLQEPGGCRRVRASSRNGRSPCSRA
jgi:hypothetical protein